MADVPEELSVAEKPYCFTKTCLYQALKPLLISFCVAGLLSRIRFDKAGLKKYLNFTYIYNTMVLIVLTIYAIRCQAVFDKSDHFGAFLFSKIACVVWILEALGHFVGFYVASCVYERLPKFFIEWDKIRKDCPESHASIIKLTKICTAVVWIFVAFFVGFKSYLLICTDSLSMLLTQLNKESPYATVVIVLNLITEFYLNFAWIAPSALMFLFCQILAIEFNRLKQTIKILARKGHLILFREFEGIRQHHDKLCILVGYADNLFSMQIAGSFAGSVFMTCLISYILIMDDPSTVLTVTEAVYLVTAAMKVLIDCISGAMINEAVSVHYSHTQIHYMLYSCMSKSLRIFWFWNHYNKVSHAFLEMINLPWKNLTLDDVFK